MATKNSVLYQFSRAVTALLSGNRNTTDPTACAQMRAWARIFFLQAGGVRSRQERGIAAQTQNPELT